MSKLIELSKGKSALIDDEDYDHVREWNWRAQQNQDGRWYAMAWDLYPNFVLMHRVILCPPDSIDVDHKNGDGLDNRRINLRLATRSQNVAAGRPAGGKSSIFKGVSWDNSRGRWRVMIKDGTKHKFLGRFADEVEAAKAYDEAALEVFGEFAYQNFGDE
jgi:hypothetical protein